MTEPTPEHLRNRPRQARSVARVEHLLDVAAAVFEEMGYDETTTNLVATRAEVPVGTLYRWFPDKAALAEGLVDRYLSSLVALYDDLLVELSPEEPIGDFLRRVMARLIVETSEQRALPALLAAAMVPGTRASAGTRLRSGLAGHIRGLVALRVPGLPDDAVGRTAEVMVTLAHVTLAAAAERERPDRDTIIGEYIDVMLAYLEAKFPSEGHPAWSDPDVVVRPIFPAPDRARRVADADGAT